MRTRPTNIKVGSTGWMRDGQSKKLPAGSPVGQRCKIYQMRPKTGEFYVLDGNRNGYTIPEECFETEREIELPFPHRGWAHESDPRALEAIRRDIENCRRLALQRPDLYPHFQEAILARNQNKSP